MMHCVPWILPVGYELPSKFVRGTVKPKSSCIVLLRQLPMSCKAPCESRPISGVRCSPDTELPLVLACVVHLSSAPASDTRKVKLRRAEMRATLAEISTVVGEIQVLEYLYTSSHFWCLPLFTARTWFEVRESKRLPKLSHGGGVVV